MLALGAPRDRLRSSPFVQINSGRDTNALKVANAVHRELVKQGGGFDDVTIVVAQLDARPK